VHPWKHFAEIDRTDEGMQMDGSIQQPEKAKNPIRESSHSGSNVTVERLEQPMKHFSHRVPTYRGMTIDFSDEQLANVLCSMHKSEQPDSNVTVVSSSQFAKQRRERACDGKAAIPQLFNSFPDSHFRASANIQLQ
jgi:hypothetical protein